VKQLSLLLLRELKRLGDPLRYVFDVGNPRREYLIHRPPEDAAGGDLFKHLLQGRLFGGLKRKL